MIENTNSKTLYTIKVVSLRKMPDPVEPTKRERYFAFCDTREIPDDLPLETNPRQQNLNTTVAKKIKEGFFGIETGQLFHLLNRGLLISAEGVDFNNKTNELTLLLSDKEKHGIVDGGHTFRIITGFRNEATLPQYITLEIMTGIEDDFVDIAGARNTSVQVKDKSLAELEGKLDLIKRMVAREPFKADIAYVEFDPKPVDVLEIIALLTIFNNGIHGENGHPVEAYAQKAATLKYYLDDEKRKHYEKLSPVAHEIFELHDYVKISMEDMCRRSRGKVRLGGRKEIGYKEGQRRWPLYFSAKDLDGQFKKMEYDIPRGFVYPILGALRYLIEDDPIGGAFRWRTDPIKFYDRDEVGPKLVDMTFDASYELGRNPNAVGKSRRHWESLYNSVKIAYLDSIRP